MTIKCVIFDLDGVTLDSRILHFVSLNQALAPYGYSITAQEQADRYEGIPTKKKLQMLTDDKRLPKELHNVVYASKQAFTVSMLGEVVRENPTLHIAFKRLKTDGYKLGLCSNSIRATVDIWLDKSGLRPYFDVALSNEDVTLPKPSPEMYIRCMAALGIGPDETVILEDSPVGIEAARQSGAHVQIVSSPSDVCLEFIQEAINGALAKPVL